MKYLITLLFLIAFLPANTQYTLTSEQWQEDLKFLQKTVNVEYPFLFKKIDALSWNKKADETFEAIPIMADHERVVALVKLVSSIGYGHTSISTRAALKPFNRLPIHLYWFKDGIYIEGGHSDYKDYIGARVSHIEGIPVEEVIQRVKPVFPAENDQFYKAYGLGLLCIPEVLHAQGITKNLKSNISFTLVKSTKTIEAVINPVEGLRIPENFGFVKSGEPWISSRDQSQTPLYLKHPDKIYYYKYLADSKTVYVRHSAIQDDPTQDIPSFYKELFSFIENNEVEKLVLDLRANGGGNNYKNKPIITGIIETKKINQVGKFFVVIGGQTFSACQNLVNELDNYTNAIFVGEPTGENINFYGDVNHVELPNSKIIARLSFAWWQDKPQWEGDDWLAPHLAVETSFEQYIRNEDPILQTILAFTDEAFITHPMDYMTQLFMDGEMEQLVKKAHEFIRDPRYKYYRFEDNLNRTGYRLLNRKQLEQACYVFQLNTELFPNSANAWDSLGEAFLKAGNSLKAEEFYNKAIALDPEGPIGDNARRMLKEIKN